MTELAGAYAYMVTRHGEVLDALFQHLLLVAVAVGVGALLGVPLGLLTMRSPGSAVVVIQSVSAIRVVPSLAILFVLTPVFGLTTRTAAIALMVLALPPVLINTATAVRGIDPALREMAASMGMSGREQLRHLDFPLALPMILAGIQTALVEVIASATLAAFIGAGGLGVFITRGFALYDTSILLVGAIPVAVLALVAETGMSLLRRAVMPPGIRLLTDDRGYDDTNVSGEGRTNALVRDNA